VNPVAPETDRRLRILILEDEGLIALHLEAVVRGVGHAVVGPVNHLEPALRIAETEPLDGAVLDIHLNGDSTSYPVAAALESRRIPFVFVTGIDKGGIAAHFPGAAVIRKPFDEDRLRDALRRMLA